MEGSWEMNACDDAQEIVRECGRGRRLLRQVASEELARAFSDFKCRGLHIIVHVEESPTQLR